MQAFIQSNEALFFIQLLVCLFCQVVVYRFYGKKGLFAWIAFAAVVCNIEVSKCVNLFGLSTTLGNILYGSTFLSTDILSELHGGKEARRSVFLGFSANIFFFVMMWLGLMYVPNEFDVVNGPMHEMFVFLPRLILASVTAFLISNTLDTYSYDFIRKWFPNRLWLRNNGSTMTSQLVDSFLWSFIAFVGVMPVKELVEMSLTTYAIKLIVAVFDTPFLYMVKGISKRHPELAKE